MYDPMTTQTMHMGGVIRLGPHPQPYVLEDSSHANMGITGITLNSGGDIVVSTCAPAGCKVIAAQAVTDETLANLGIDTGISGGLATSVIQLYRNGGRVRADSSIFTTTANLWFLVTFIPPGCA